MCAGNGNGAMKKIIGLNQIEVRAGACVHGMLARVEEKGTLACRAACLIRGITGCGLCYTRLFDVPCTCTAVGSVLRAQENACPAGQVPSLRLSFAGATI